LALLFDATFDFWLLIGFAATRVDLIAVDLGEAVFFDAMTSFALEEPVNSRT
jgi:hypothetical protein